MRISRRRFVATTTAGSIVAVAAGAEFHVRGYRTRPQLRCELPCHDYTPGQLIGPVTAISAPAIPLAIVSGPTAGGQALLFNHFKPPVLRLDQCLITLESLEIRNDGSYALKLIAEQNARSLADPPLVAVGRPLPPGNTTTVPSPGIILPGASPISKYTAYIKRNTFFVRFRGASSTGRTVPLDIRLVPFVVENGESCRPVLIGLDPRIQTYFDAIDLVEIDLSYR